MARKKQNKSALIRAALVELGAEARNRDVIERLAADKVKVTAQMVSTVRKRASESAPSRNGAGGKGPRGRKRAVQSVSMAALLNAKRLVDEAGSVDAAKQTLAALAQLL